MNKALSIFCSCLLLVALGGCGDDRSHAKHSRRTQAGKKPAPDLSKKTLFAKLVQKFKPLSMPLTIQTLDIQSTAKYRKIAGRDTLFIRSGFPEETWAYGMLPDTSLYYQLVWLSPAEIYDPVLTIFNKSGDKLSEKHLGVGGCGSDCGFTCEEYIYIKEDRSIYAVDSITRSPCDGSNLKKGAKKRYIRYMSGSIGADGRISMTGVKEKPY